MSAPPPSRTRALTRYQPPSTVTPPDQSPDEPTVTQPVSVPAYPETGVNFTCVWTAPATVVVPVTATTAWFEPSR